MPFSKKILRHAVVFAALAMFTDTAPAAAAEDTTDIVPPRRVVDYDETRALLADIKDPWEGWNRRVYVFNARFDRYVFLPAVRVYKTITPDPIEVGIWNVFQNVGEVRTLLHSLLQLKPRSMGITVGRLVVNSSIGIVGLFDPATDLGLIRRSEDFGQTLGRWGVGAGPYTVLPIFGPSNVRDTAGMLGDYALTVAAYQAIGLNGSDLLPVRSAITLLRAVSTRDHMAFRYYETGSPFEYELVRYLYTKIREVEILK